MPRRLPVLLALGVSVREGWDVGPGRMRITPSLSRGGGLERGSPSQTPFQRVFLGAEPLLLLLFWARWFPRQEEGEPNLAPLFPKTTLKMCGGPAVLAPREAGTVPPSFPRARLEFGVRAAEKP